MGAVTSRKPSSQPALISAVSYNIHQCVGMDRRRDPSRIAEVLNELDVDIIGLQEVHSDDTSEESHQMNYLAQATRRIAVAGPLILKAKGEYGNVLLSRYPVVNTRRLDLSVPRREARGAIDADIETPHGPVRVIVSHLGLGTRERYYQAKQLLGSIAQHTASPLIVLLDFNEWFPWGFPIRFFNEEFGKAPVFRTFPASRPVLALDRIWVKPRAALVSLRRHITPLTRVASDHLPLHAMVDPSQVD